MSNTPRTDAKESESVNCELNTHLHYGWKFARQLETELAEARQQLETERMRLAACSTAALGYFTDCLPEYRSAALEDVLQLRQQLVEQDALVERMQSVIEDLEVYAACFIEGTTPKISIENAREDFADAEAVISFTPSTALAAHDAEVRRKALEEAAGLLANDAFAMTFQTMGQYRTELLRRMAKGE